MNLRLLVLFLLVVNLSGCGWFFGDKEVITKSPDRIVLVLPETSPVKMDPVDWTIITNENQQEVFDNLKNKNQQPVLLGLTDTGYENLSLNFAKLRAYILTQKKVIEIYKDYYEKTEKSKEAK